MLSSQLHSWKVASSRRHIHSSLKKNTVCGLFELRNTCFLSPRNWTSWVAWMLCVRIFSGGCRGRVAAKILVSRKKKVASRCPQRPYMSYRDVFVPIYSWAALLALHLCYLQSRPPKEWQSLRSKTTTPALKTAAVTATKVAEEVEQGVQESSTSPVCAYNEWDPLEVCMYIALELLCSSEYEVYCLYSPLHIS